MRTINDRGVTLVEIMVAILLFLLGIAALLGVITQSVQSAKKAGFTYKAHNLAKSRLETLKSDSFGNLLLWNETATVIDEQGVPTLSGSFVRNTTVAANYTGDSGLAYVKVSVNYIYRGQQSPAPMEASTVIYSNG